MPMMGPGGVLPHHHCPRCGRNSGSFSCDCERHTEDLKRNEMKPLEPDFKLDLLNVIPIETLPKDLGGDVHETFKLDRYGNIYGGHTTIRLPGDFKKRFSWEDDE